MSTPCAVVIGANELLEAIRQSMPDGSEVLTFSDTEPLKALEAITARRPNVIALERLFAATSRGAALINRIKADPSLTNAEIRVVSVDGTYRVSPRRVPSPPADAATPPAAPDSTSQTSSWRSSRRRLRRLKVPRRRTSTIAAHAVHLDSVWPRARKRKWMA